MTTRLIPPSETPAPSLVGWGASPDADLVYRRLVTFGRAPTATLARELGLSRRRLNQALDELASLGAAAVRRTASQGGVIWTPRAATEVIASLRANSRRPNGVDAGRYLRERPAPAADALEQLEQAAELGDGLRHLGSREMTRTRLAELVAVARHEHLAMNPETIFAAESAQSAVAMDRRLLERGVSMRVLGVQPAHPDPMSQHGRTLADLPPTYRQAPTVPMKLLVVDREIAFFPVTPSDFDRGYLEVSQPPIVAALVAVFEEHWRASPAAQEYSMPQIALDPREQALIGLLAQGHTDATAARELRISTRSVSTTVRTLMDRLCVENRFQLGLALGALHVATPPRP